LGDFSRRVFRTGFAAALAGLGLRESVGAVRVLATLRRYFALPL
jgi:hypothetical protein